MNRVLVAGIGNVFFGDDAFGVAVARALTPPPGVTVTDFGIRALHFAFELTTPFDLCIIADCMPRGGEPGTLYVLEPELDDNDTVGVASALATSAASCRRCSSSVASPNRPSPASGSAARSNERSRPRPI